MPIALAPHSRSLRIGRFSEPNRAYVVTSVTSGRRPIFFQLKLGRIVVNAFRYQEAAGRASTVAFVVMPDHFHWLLELQSTATLSAVVQSVKAYAGKAINCELRAGEQRIWQPGFHDHAVRRDEDLAEIARYIIANPLRAGLVQSVREYSLWDAPALVSTL